MTYERGVSKGRPDISVLVELTVLSKLWKKQTGQFTRDTKIQTETVTDSEPKAFAASTIPKKVDKHQQMGAYLRRLGCSTCRSCAYVWARRRVCGSGSVCAGLRS